MLSNPCLRGLLCFALFVGYCAIAKTAYCVPPEMAFANNSSAAEQRIQAALDEPTDLEFFDTALIDVTQFLEDKHHIQIELDSRALDAVGIGSDTPITQNLKGITLRSALRLMLRDLELTFVIQDEVLMITTPEESQTLADVRIYNVAELLEEDEPADILAEVLNETLRDSGPRLSAMGGFLSSAPGTVAPSRARPEPKRARRITAYGQLLIVRDTTEGHRELAELLAAMHKATHPPEINEQEPAESDDTE